MSNNDRRADVGAPSAAGVALILSCALAWGCNWPVTKFALSEIPPLEYRAFGLLIAGAATLAIARAQGRRLIVPRLERWPLAVISLFNVTLFNVFAVYGVLLLPAGRAIVITYTFSIWTALFGRLLLGERLTGERLLGVALGVGGLAVLIGPDVVRLRAAPWGIILAVAASIAWALGSIFFKQRRWSLTSTELSGWQLVIGSLPMFVPMWAFEPSVSPFALSAPVALAWIYFTAVGMTYGYWAWFAGLRLISPVIASIGSFAAPVVGVFFAGFLLGERAGVREYAGLALVVASLVVVFVGRAGIRKAVGKR
jgi:drug/metabolite transporter (DMT)-like permease